jgi:hypothetical protein
VKSDPIYIKEIETSIMKPWDTLSDFLDKHPEMPLDQIHALLRFGGNDTFEVVSTEEWEKGDEIYVAAQ